MLDDKLKALWARISPPQKAAFFGCFLSGYLVHLYVFTNIIPNSDGLTRPPLSNLINWTNPPHPARRSPPPAWRRPG